MATLNGNLWVGVGAAVAATILAPVLLPALGAVGRPLAKSLVRGGMVLYDRSREAVALVGEAAEDIVAEIRAEQLVPAGDMPATSAPRGQPAQAREGAVNVDAGRDAARAGEAPVPAAAAPAGNGAATA